jgi:hypothetical protein
VVYGFSNKTNFFQKANSVAETDIFTPFSILEFEKIPSLSPRK